jgi:hypothetical protein
MRLLGKTLLVTALTLAASAGGTGVAMAAAPVTPVNGSAGACNMTNANAAYGMFTISQFRANPNGWDAGMGTAINNSTANSTSQGNCGVPTTPPPRP